MRFQSFSLIKSLCDKKCKELGYSYVTQPLTNSVEFGIPNNSNGEAATLITVSAMDRMVEVEARVDLSSELDRDQFNTMLQFLNYINGIGVIDFIFYVDNDGFVSAEKTLYDIDGSAYCGKQLTESIDTAIKFGQQFPKYFEQLISGENPIAVGAACKEMLRKEFSSKAAYCF